MLRILSILLLCWAPCLANAQFFTLDQATGTTGGELGLTFLTFEDNDEISAQLIRGFAEFSTAQTGERWSGYLAFASGSLSADEFGQSETFYSVLGVELGGAYTQRLSSNAEVTFRAGMTLPRDGSRDELIAATIVTPARLTDLLLLLPEVGALRLGGSAHGKSDAVVYRLDVGLDVALFGDFADDVDPTVRINAAIGLLAGPTTIGLELANLINPTQSGDDAMLHTFSAGIRGDFIGVQPGLALTFPLDEDLSDLYSTVVQVSLRAELQ